MEQGYWDSAFTLALERLGRQSWRAGRSGLRWPGLCKDKPRFSSEGQSLEVGRDSTGLTTAAHQKSIPSLKDETWGQFINHLSPCHTFVSAQLCESFTCLFWEYLQTFTVGFHTQQLSPTGVNSQGKSVSNVTAACLSKPGGTNNRWRETDQTFPKLLKLGMRGPARLSNKHKPEELSLARIPALT